MASACSRAAESAKWNKAIGMARTQASRPSSMSIDGAPFTNACATPAVMPTHSPVAECAPSRCQARNSASSASRS
ncbi:MAG: hypothetical protein EBR51_04620 [Gammaproteobacteria bacterium]|nr:hypothetical protein [Gammaproteobacteria bacterium]